MIQYDIDISLTIQYLYLTIFLTKLPASQGPSVVDFSTVITVISLIPKGYNTIPCFFHKYFLLFDIGISSTFPYKLVQNVHGHLHMLRVVPSTYASYHQTYNISAMIYSIRQLQ